MYSDPVAITSYLYHLNGLGGAPIFYCNPPKPFYNYLMVTELTVIIIQPDAYNNIQTKDINVRHLYRLELFTHSNLLPELLLLETVAVLGSEHTA